MNIGNRIIDDVSIEAQGRDIDGPGGILGQAGPTQIRPQTAGQAAFLPALGVMTFDSADLDQMEQNGTLVDVITHEMGHVLGIGTVWDLKGFLSGDGGPNPIFTGPGASAEYGRLRGLNTLPVPLENTGGPGTRDSHWRETIFRNELMSGFIEVPGNPISAVTVASLRDLGYEVDMGKAEPFSLPNLLEMAERGDLVMRSTEEMGKVLSTIPMILPDSSIQ